MQGLVRTEAGHQEAALEVDEVLAGPRLGGVRVLIGHRREDLAVGLQVAPVGPGQHAPYAVQGRSEQQAHRFPGQDQHAIVGGQRNAGAVRVLCGHPEVVEAAVVGVPCPALGERGHAFVVTRGRAGADTLRAYCAARLSDYKVPETYDIQQEPLPRKANGRLLKRVLNGRMVTPAK